LAAYQDRTTSDAQIVSIPDWSDWQVDGTLTVEGYKKFQFQIGPIGSPALLQFPFLISRFSSRLVRLAVLFDPDKLIHEFSFNSRLVRLAVFLSERRVKRIAVSIPDWSDWQGACTATSAQ